MIKYTILEDQKKVIAKLEGCEFDVYDIISKKANVLLPLDIVVLKSTYKGVSKCHPSDTFNVEEGKKVAREKLLSKYYKSYNAALKRATSYVGDMSDSVSKVCENHKRGFKDTPSFLKK